MSFYLQISTRTLSRIKFPRVGKMKTVTIGLSEEAGTSLKCDFLPAQCQMLHVPTARVRSQKEAMNMKARAFAVCSFIHFHRQNCKT